MLQPNGTTGRIPFTTLAMILPVAKAFLPPNAKLIDGNGGREGCGVGSEERVWLDLRAR